MLCRTWDGSKVGLAAPAGASDEKDSLLRSGPGRLSQDEVYRLLAQGSL